MLENKIIGNLIFRCSEGIKAEMCVNFLYLSVLKWCFNFFGCIFKKLRFSKNV